MVERRRDVTADAWLDDVASIGTGLPLEGVRILDLSRVLAGPLAAMVLGDLGADVIKVEQPAGDPVRAMGPPSIGDTATYYVSVNRNRRSVVADLTTDEGRDLVARLAASADAVVENFLPSQAEDLGIAELRDRLSDVVWVTVSPAAQGGPLADQPAFDLLAQARSGLMGVSGTPESGPMKTGAPVADVVTGLYAAIGLLAALLDQQVRPGAPGRRIEAPLLESAVTVLINQTAGFLGAGAVPGLLGNDHPSIVPYAPYRTADRDVLLAVGTESQWTRLVEAIGAPELADDDRFARNGDRVVNRDQLRVLLEETLAQRGCDEWIGILSDAGVPCAPVNDVPAALGQEQIATGDLLTEVVLEDGATTGMVLSPLRVDGRRPGVRRRPPGLGEHTEEITSQMEQR
jgi:crotonobetainyl-CoA:carnitine CoA-transferase CaiB-like acyl-CoA transferase